MLLPHSFMERMRKMLSPEDFTAFMASYENESVQGLRLNPQKVAQENFTVHLPFRLEPVPWCPTGFYYGEDDRPGKHPYHAAGLYYMQEPSAMAVVEVLVPEPGDRVLDLCAAPGGKTTQISGYLGNTGMLLSNEIHPARAKILSENVERWGARNILVTNEPPDKLAERFPSYFDKIVVDAPCSGEGMFRKLSEAVEDWSENKVAQCAAMQKDILDQAADMLKPGGVLVYSTCTFAPSENESQIAAFLNRRKDFTLEESPLSAFFAHGVPEWSDANTVNPSELVETMRLWPHRLKGEGHYIARMRKSAGDTETAVPAQKDKKLTADVQKLFEAFCNDALTILPDGRFELFGDQLYILPDGMPSLNRLKVKRAGWHLGTLKKGRFEPSHALALSLTPGEWKRSADFSADNDDILRYLRGESLMVDSSENGWTVVTVDGYPLGWGKIVNGQLKNHYPKGLRWV
ncbi:RsmF rRNA methyltransferase first C-terminal domain-containing protein [Aneurinibacillus sp. Ricciae_BoGa-3]|uniref:RsmF rRNA methyltransferase first C-terminal domain-containing protein n=1 Tax=Aneurinibacillus sp. Ricciae_BoGa-3 TaxID=3022697 RepID=UPI0023411F8C|nr:RsmF rRNA methyltransferase first C-terminal domain-containing protein [Aneurinibacillus sp. Ricciae_BoGa-3]WCK55682.1 RsmF rRNA methyltransferase first C-terminal domain-containing protein [Aneurinibacillus sp. Ricciae_BoGa-3]